MASASPLLSALLLLPLFITLTSLFHHHVIPVASAASSTTQYVPASYENAIFHAKSFQCRSGWTNTLQTISPSQINDGYCDCPYGDGQDEPSTGACAGSMDGMWAGIPAKHEPSDYDAAQISAHFVCPQQPSLKLPLSRVNDGICDCCDGADESESSTTSCPDVCNEVLAEERAALAKSRQDYDIGSQKRQQSISQYQQWYADSQEEIQTIKNVDLVTVEKELDTVEYSLIDAKISLAKDWISLVEEVKDHERLRHVVDSFGDDDHNIDLASFIISLCQLASESSRAEYANDRCVALDRASLDVGILWNYDTFDKDDVSVLPTFEKLDTTETAQQNLVDYAEKLIVRMEGKDTAKPGKRPLGNKNKKGSEPKKVSRHTELEDSSDDPYGDDWEDHHDHHYDDDYMGGEDEDYSHENEEGESSESQGETAEEAEKQSTPVEVLVKSLLDKVPIDRTLFKQQSKLLVDYSLPEVPQDDDSDNESEEAEEKEVKESSTEDNESEESESGVSVDPMAIQMVQSTLSNLLSNISWGEISAKSAARFVASVMSNKDDLQDLAIMMMYHSKVTSEDVAELIYSSSKFFSLIEEDGHVEEKSCSVPWASMCPPRGTVEDDHNTYYPPSFIFMAAHKRCEQRENAPGVCTVQSLEGEDAMLDFPTTIPDGYYNYYAPKSRTGADEDGEDDALTTYFSSLDALRRMPRSLVDLRKHKEAIHKKMNSLTSKVSDLELETGGTSGASPKYGVDGELYILRDTCHKLESGKYEYEVCIFGKATQRDIGQTSGGTNLGTWDKEEIDNDFQRTLMWGGGTKCWNGPVRSAEVVVTCGADSKVLTADEPETCRYVFTMESPIGCDEQFKMKNKL